MAAWLIPALKAVLPHVGTIISAAAPVFTRSKTGTPDESSGLLQKQIGELQAAAVQNAAHVKDLAAQLQTTVAALEEAAALAESRLRRTRGLCIAATLLAALSLLIVVVTIIA